MTSDRIAQLIVKKIVDQDGEDVEMLDEMEWAYERFGSTRLGLELKETQPMICFLYSDRNHEFYDTPDIYHHPTLQRGQILMSNAIIAKANLKNFKVNFLTKVQQAALEDADWVRRKEELEYMEKEEKKLPIQWTISDNLLYYKNRLYILVNEDLQTLIAKGCHNLQIAGHFGQNKTLEIITRDFY